MRVLGINSIGHHDASACLVEDGALTAFVEEERLTRVKHATGQRPVNAVRWCLESRGLSWHDIDVVATPWFEEEFGVLAPPGYDVSLTFSERDRGGDRQHWPGRIAELIEEAGCPSDATPRLLQVSHHLAHAASAYWLGGLEEATILVADGEGDRVATTIAHGRAGRITPVVQMSTVDSLGQFFACLTTYLGFGFFGEGKLMGLAPYGRPVHEFPEFKLSDDGYRVELPGALRRYDPVGTDYRVIIDAWYTVLTDRFGPPRPLRDGPAPSTLADWPELDRDLAASAQYTLENVLSHVARLGIRTTGSANLVVAGGVALNCSANGVLASLPEVGRFFVQPIAGDNGAPIGAALHAAALAGEATVTTMRSVGLGPVFDSDACASALDRAGLKYRGYDDVADAAAGLLSEGKVVCWHQDAMEGGPRALGRRSILASPDSIDLRDRVNAVKRRSPWRPVAPSVLAEHSPEVFASGRESPFMIVSDRVRPEWRERLAGVTHVDGSARPQTVDPTVNPLYWSLLSAFHRRTGLPAVVNTSFNGEDEPIVCTPDEAIRTFLRRGGDALCIGPYIAERPENS
jgi:carbamoyltransferase